MGDDRVDSRNRIYGYRRNLLGFIRYGWTCTLIGTGLATAIVWLGIGTESSATVWAGATGLTATIFWSIVWKVRNRESLVKEAAEDYAKQLFDAVA